MSVASLKPLSSRYLNSKLSNCEPPGVSTVSLFMPICHRVDVCSRAVVLFRSGESISPVFLMPSAPCCGHTTTAMHDNEVPSPSPAFSLNVFVRSTCTRYQSEAAHPGKEFLSRYYATAFCPLLHLICLPPPPLYKLPMFYVTFCICLYCKLPASASTLRAYEDYEKTWIVERVVRRT